MSSGCAWSSGRAWSSGAACLDRPRPAAATDRPVAASSAVRSALRRTTTSPSGGTVLAVFPCALYVAVGGDVVAVVTRDGLRLPNALVLPRPGVEAPFAVHRPGAPARTTGGSLHVATSSGPPVSYRPVRWWDPREALAGPVGAVQPAVVAALARGLAAAAPACSAASPPADSAPQDAPHPGAAERLATASTELGAALHEHDLARACAAADALVGLGPGLTPAGDDVLAGVLVTCRQLAGGPGAAPVAALARELGQHLAASAAARTTSLSAALLRHAGAGRAAPPVLGVVDALVGRRPLAPALADLLAVGHSSGGDTASGVLTAARALLAAATPHPPEDL